MEIAIFSTHRFEKETLNAAMAGVSIKYFEEGLSLNTSPLAKGADVVSIFVNDDASAPVLASLRKIGVRCLLLRCAGYNHVDLDAALRYGISVLRVPAYSPYAVAEHTIALMLALNRKLVRADTRVKDGNFSLNGLVGFDMHGKTMGIFGLGQIGEKVARIALGMGCKVLAVDHYVNDELVDQGVEYVEADELYEKSDVITLHCPLTPTTQYLINVDAISKMRPGVMLINTSRGGLINTKAVIQGLKHKQIGYLGLDVYEEEKGLFFEDHSDDVLQDDVIARLLSFPNVMVTSHQGFLTKTALKNIADTTRLNFDQFVAGVECENAVL